MPDTSITIDSSPEDAVPIYPQLAARMSSTLAAVHIRRFDELAILDLFRDQSALCRQETELKRIQAEDAMSPDGVRSRYSRNLEWLETLSDPKTPGGSAQLEVMNKTRTILWPYLGKLSLFSKLLMLSPNRYDLKHAVQGFLEEQGKRGKHMEGPDKGVYYSPKAPDHIYDDLISLVPRPQEDWVTEWCCNSLVPWFKRVFKAQKDPRRKAIIQNDETVRKGTKLVLCVVASQLQIVFIAVLCYIETVQSRLVIMSLSSLLFTFTLALWTDCRRIEIFSTTAAYLAVLMAYFGGQQGYPLTLSSPSRL